MGCAEIKSGSQKIPPHSHLGIIEQVLLSVFQLSMFLDFRLYVHCGVFKVPSRDQKCLVASVKKPNRYLTDVYGVGRCNIDERVDVGKPFVVRLCYMHVSDHCFLVVIRVHRLCVGDATCVMCVVHILDALSKLHSRHPMSIYSRYRSFKPAFLYNLCR
jgi:hypothetical protein